MNRGPWAAIVGPWAAIVGMWAAVAAAIVGAAWAWGPEGRTTVLILAIVCVPTLGIVTLLTIAADSNAKKTDPETKG